MLFPNITYAYYGGDDQLFYGVNTDASASGAFTYKSLRHKISLKEGNLVFDCKNRKPVALPSFANVSMQQLLEVLSEIKTSKTSTLVTKLLSLIDGNTIQLAKLGFDDIAIIHLVSQNPRLIEFCDNPLLFFMLINAHLENMSGLNFDGVKRHALLNNIYQTVFTASDVKFMRNIDIESLGIDRIMQISRGIYQNPNIFSLYKRKKLLDTNMLIKHLRLAETYDETSIYEIAQIVDAEFMLELMKGPEEAIPQFVYHFNDACLILHELNDESYTYNKFVDELRGKKSLDAVKTKIDAIVGGRADQFKRIYSRKELTKPFPKPYLKGDDRLIFHLSTPMSLFEESKRLKHCVYGYGQRVINRELDLYQYVDSENNETGTLEVTRNPDTKNYTISQFLGYRNKPMSKMAWTKATLWLHAESEKYLDSREHDETK